MATRVEWAKLTRNAENFFLAIGVAVGSALTRRGRVNKRPQRSHHVILRNRAAVDLRLATEIERRKSLAILNNARSQVR